MKNKTLRRALSMILAVVMLLGVFAGCNTDKPVGTSEPTKETEKAENPTAAPTAPQEYVYDTGFTVSISGRRGTTEDWDGTMIVKYLEDMFGVDIEAIPENDDVFDTKWNLMMAEEDVPDIVTNVTWNLAQVSQWGKDGYLLPINEYLEHMPNLSAYFEANPEYKAACTSADGNIYGLQSISENIYNNVTRSFINEDWLNRVGMEYPTTLDELYEVLKAFKEQDANGNGDPNDEIPFAWTENYSRKTLHNILNACGIVTEKNTSKPWGILEVSEDGTVYLADTTDNYRYFLTYMNKLWEEELCLMTAYTSTKAEVQAMIKENIIGVMAESGSAWPISEDDVNPSARWEYLGGMTSAVNDVPIIGATNTVSNQIKVVISADTEHPEEICRLVDYFYTEAGTRVRDLYWYAETFEEIGKVYYKDLDNPVIIPGLEDYPIYNVHPDTANTVPEGYDKWGTYAIQKLYINEAFNIIAPMDPTDLPYIVSASGASDELCDTMIEMNARNSAWVAQIHKRINDEGEAEIRFGYPIMVYEEAVVDERTSIWTDLFLLCQTAQAQFITGEKDIENDADWNTFLKDLEKAGLTRLLEIEQEAYDALYKN